MEMPGNRHRRCRPAAPGGFFFRLPFPVRRLDGIPCFPDNPGFPLSSTSTMPIRLIVGLGNPGAEYEQTRHNAGFWLVDNLAQAQGCSLSRETRFQALAGKTRLAGQEVWLLEPQTFMNRSGQSVGALARFYKIAADEVLV